MKKLLLILLCLPMIGFGQNVNIPDTNFKACLVGNTNINTNGDAEIQLSEASAFNGHINCANINISDLTGVEFFTASTHLDCQENQLISLDVSNNLALTTLYFQNNNITSIDVSNNTNLTTLYCYGNQLTSLDVSQNTALTTLHSGYNQLTSLDVSQNTALTTLSCNSNQLTSLDVSQNTALTELICGYNQLTSLDLSQNTSINVWSCNSNQLTSLDVRNGNNTNIGYFNALDNPNLTCIDVDDVNYSTTNWTDVDIDPQHYYSNNCSGTTHIEEHTTNKELLKVTDLLGREIKQTNQPLFYIYDDGTVEKRIVIE